MSSNKLHAIYTALENFNYTKAIKQCLAQPASNSQAQALLAHAYARSGQRYKALVTMQSILLAADGANDNHDNNGDNGACFAELELEIKYSLERRVQQLEALAHPPTATAAAASSGASRKGGKKSKKKPVAQATAVVPSASQDAAKELQDWDLVDQLDSPPFLPKDWDKLPPAAKAFTDDTLLSTLSMTLLTHLKLPLSNYQLHCWAASAPDADEVAVRRAFSSGFAVLVAPQYESIAPTILADMQVLALQLSRLQQQQYGVSPAATWAAQTALWQVQYKGTSAAVQDNKQEQRLTMLPRLAESLANKSVQQEGLTPQEGLVSPEAFLLYLRTLDEQNKWEEMLAALDERLPELAASERMSPPRQIMIDSKLNVLEKLKRHTEARGLLEKELLKEYPDDWTYWKRHLDCSLKEAGDDIAGLAKTEALVDKTISALETSSRYPLRGPKLMRLELAAVRLRRSKADECSEQVALLIDCIVVYSEEFAAKASCTFSDMCPYLELALESCSIDSARSLADRLSKFRVDPTSDDIKERRRELRSYIFSVKMAYKIVAMDSDLKDQLPDWKDILQVWRQFQTFEQSSGQGQEQKESRPGDDLILLALQQLTHETATDAELGFAAAVLESAMLHSPDNAFLKIAGIFLYSQIDAVPRSWDLFRDLFIKHIQHESCAYIILPLLRAGGLYGETIAVCSEILRLQAANLRDAGEFTGRAMENGTMSKAGEFLEFQRSKLNHSLTTLEAKGLILDCAPMYINNEKQSALGAVHGIVGGEADIDRASQMVTEAHNPLAAFSLLRLKGTTAENLETFSDNRDFSILSNDLLNPRKFDSQEKVVSDSIRRGQHHNLIIRAALCVDAAKGPKKGKLVAATNKLKKRSASLVSSVAEAQGYCAESNGAPGHEALLSAMLSMCGIITGLAAGDFSQADSSASADTLENREDKTCQLLMEAAEKVTLARQELNLADDQRISRVGMLLPDYIVPTFALVQMCAKMLETFGWGRRKRKTRRCAASLFDLTSTLVSLIADMQTCSSRLPLESFSSWNDYSSVFPGFCEESILQETSALILQSQEASKARIEVVLSDVLNFLKSFEVDN